jgi:signal transduction histidine kinase
MAGEEDDASHAGAMQLRDLLRLDPEGGYRTEDPVETVLRTGMPLLLALGGAEAPGSAMIVPLLARDRTTGALIFAAVDSGRHFDTADLALAEELARRAALAIDNARLYHEAQEAIRARDEVHRIVAHDLRNPLYGIKLMLSLIAKRVRAESDWAEEAEYAELARQAVQRMERLIQDMLDVARLEAGSLSIECERQGAAALLVETITFHQTLATDSALEFEHLAPADLPEVLADRGRVLQVFGNLIGNAIKFTPAGGRITLRAEVAGLEIHFSVADTGPGIPPDHLPHLFDRFWQAERGRRDGAGLGLAIARGIVEAHGGRIWAESALGAGTAFHFTLPVAPVAAS